MLVHLPLKQKNARHVKRVIHHNTPIVLLVTLKQHTCACESYLPAAILGSFAKRRPARRSTCKARESPFLMPTAPTFNYLRVCPAVCAGHGTNTSDSGWTDTASSSGAESTSMCTLG